MTRLKNLDILILDCGEDKLDSHREYEGMADFHTMRLEETEFLKKSLSDYDTTRKKFRLVVSHIPFNYKNTESCKGERPFNIEDELYNSWCASINDFYDPSLYIAGHLHRTEVWDIENVNNHRKLNCPTIIGSKPEKNNKDNKMTCCFINLSDNSIGIKFNDNMGKTSEFLNI